MRSTPVLTALALALALARPAPAQTGPDLRTVTREGAEARSGPSDNFYPTNRLHRGDTVEVLQELPDGWLKVRPPAGSYSWIPLRFLKHIVPEQPNYVADIPEGVEAPVYVGSEVINDRPTVVGAKLPRGTQVVSIGKPQDKQDNEGPWMPIESPPGEARYLRAADVERLPPGSAHTTAAAGSAFTPAVRPTPSAPAGPLAPSSAPSADPASDPRLLRDRAVRAHWAGQYDEAVRLYRQAASAGARTDPALSSWAAGWANYLESVNRPPARATPASRLPAHEVRTPNPPDKAPTPAAPPGARLAPPKGTSADANAGAAPAPEFATHSGRLREAGCGLGYQKAYVLEADGRPFLYMTAPAGVDLQPYVGRDVEVTGRVAYHNELRAYYMPVARVRPLP
jgi:hypothetical protein